MRGLLTAALAESVLVSWRDLHQERIPPLPSDYVAVAILYGGLALFPESASTFTSLVGWGFVLATFLNLWNPASPLTLAPKNQDLTRSQAPGFVGPLPSQ